MRYGNVPVQQRLVVQRHGRWQPDEVPRLRLGRNRADRVHLRGVRLQVDHPFLSGGQMTYMAILLAGIAGVLSFGTA